MLAENLLVSFIVLFASLAHAAESRRILVFATDQSIPRDSPERRALNPEMSAKAERFLIDMIESFHKAVVSGLLDCDLNAFSGFVPTEGRPPLGLAPYIIESSNASRVAVLHIDNNPEVQIKVQYVEVERLEGSKPTKPAYRASRELMSDAYTIDFSPQSASIQEQVEDAANRAVGTICGIEKYTGENK